MILKQVLDIVDLLDAATVDGDDVRLFFEDKGLKTFEMITVEGESGKTDFVKMTVVGKEGKKRGGDAPTLGVVGRLGGIGARPERIGLVSNGDGAICALSVALKLMLMQRAEDILSGDVIIATHICPESPTIPHDPVPFMGAPVDMRTMNRLEVDADMDAVVTIDTTKGNDVLNRMGFAITPTVKQGYILPAAPSLLRMMEITTGRRPAVLPLSQQDITPYGNGLDHINSLMQPAVASEVPVVGLAITAESAVPGCATGASREVDIASAAKFVVEVAKEFTGGECQFYSRSEFERLNELYGSMEHFKTLGK